MHTCSWNAQRLAARERTLKFCVRVYVSFYFFCFRHPSAKWGKNKQEKICTLRTVHCLILSFWVFYLFSWCRFLSSISYSALFFSFDFFLLLHPNQSNGCKCKCISFFSSVRKWSGLKSLLFLYLNMYVQGIRSVPHCKQFYNNSISAICHYAINGLTIRKYFHLRLYSSLAITAVDAFVISILKWCGS